MKSSLPPPTAEEVRRFEDMQAIGCICCIQKQNVLATEAEIHHQLGEGGNRISHLHTVALCPYHHRAQRTTIHGIAYYQKVKGPSLARSPAWFHAEFGSDAEQLAFQNELIRSYRSIREGDSRET